MAPSKNSRAVNRQAPRGRGYHRPRPRPSRDAVIFEVQGHQFETDWRDLWVTPSGTDRVDRIKVTRGSVSRSAQRGYPPELFRSEDELQEEAARSMAAFWLTWKESPDAAQHKPVMLDHHRRAIEFAAGKEFLEAR